MAYKDKKCELGIHNPELPGLDWPSRWPTPNTHALLMQDELDAKAVLCHPIHLALTVRVCSV